MGTYYKVKSFLSRPMFEYFFSTELFFQRTDLIRDYNCNNEWKQVKEKMLMKCHVRHILYICGLRLDLFENTVNNPITKINNNNATSLHLMKNKIEVKSFFNIYKRCVAIKYSHNEINECILQGGQLYCPVLTKRKTTQEKNFTYSTSSRNVNTKNISLYLHFKHRFVWVPLFVIDACLGLKLREIYNICNL